MQTLFFGTKDEQKEFFFKIAQNIINTTDYTYLRITIDYVYNKHIIDQNKTTTTISTILSEKTTRL